MAGKTKRAALILTENQKTMLNELSRSRTAPMREVERAKVLIGYADGISIIRVVLDNHSAHISKETITYLATRPGRFEYVHTPKHGSWLNLIECAFSKMSRTFLRHIRVNSVDELKMRILRTCSRFHIRSIL